MTLEELQEQINELRQKMVKADDLTAIEADFKNQLNGTAARLQRTSKDSFEKVQETLAQLTEKISQQPDPQETEPTTTNSEQNDNPASTEQPQSDPRISQLEQQIANLIQSNQSLQNKVDESDRARLEALKQQQRTGHQNAFINAATPFTDHPQRLLTLAQAEGKFEESDNGLVVKTSEFDQMGNPIYKPATEFVESWLQQDFPFLAKPRGGSGTGATPEGQSQQSQPIQAQSVFESMTKDLD